MSSASTTAKITADPISIPHQRLSMTCDAWLAGDSVDWSPQPESARTREAPRTVVSFSMTAFSRSCVAPAARGNARRIGRQNNDSTSKRIRAARLRSGFHQTLYAFALPEPAEREQERDGDDDGGHLEHHQTAAEPLVGNRCQAPQLRGAAVRRVKARGRPRETRSPARHRRPRRSRARRASPPARTSVAPAAPRESSPTRRCRSRRRGRARPHEAVDGRVSRRREAVHATHRGSRPRAAATRAGARRSEGRRCEESRGRAEGAGR